MGAPLTSANPRYAIWFVPFRGPGEAGTEPSALQSAYEPAADGSGPLATNAQPFSVSLKSVYFTAASTSGLLDKIEGDLEGKPDILIASVTALGPEPQVQRVHYYDHMPKLSAGAPLSDILSDTIYVCNDYNGTDRLWLELQVYQVPPDPANRNALVQSFQDLSQQFDSIFPVAIPYTLVASDVVTAINQLIQQLNGNRSLLDTHFGFMAKTGRGQPLLRAGFYILFAQPTDGAQYALQENAALLRKDGAPVDITYAVLTLDFDAQQDPNWDDKVNEQRVATLLTGLRLGGNPDKAQATIHFLSDTLTKYSDWKALERYRQLSTIPDNKRTSAQNALLATIEQNADLKPYLQILDKAFGDGADGSKALPAGG